MSKQKSNNESLYEDVLSAINKLFSDREVSKSECINNLENLVDEINILIQSLEEVQS